MPRTPLLLAVPAALLLARTPAARPSATAPDQEKKLDSKTLAAIDALAADWFAARPRTCFEEWDAKKRADLEARAKAIGAIPEGALPALVERVWKIAHKHAPKWKPGKHDNEFETPYGPAWWLQKGKGGPKEGFALGLHGGGEGAGDASEAEGNWNVKGCLCMYPQGIRLVHDTWNTVHGERFALSLIELAKWKYDCDPDRFYSVGFSMGGTGTFFLAGRYPDLFAGAIPAHGVLMAAPQSQLWKKEEVTSIQHGLLPNLRNLAMYWYTGTIDDHCKPGTYLYAWDRLQELKAADPEGYGKLRFKLWENVPHTFPKGEPENGLEYILKERRDAFPAKFVWEYASDPYPLPDADEPCRRCAQHWFYDLHCTAPVDHMRISVERKGNEFDVKLFKASPERCELMLQPKLIDVKQDVVVRVDGKEVFRGRPQPDFFTVLESLDARLDKTLVFDRRVPLAPATSAAGR